MVCEQPAVDARSVTNVVNCEVVLSDHVSTILWALLVFILTCSKIFLFMYRPYYCLLFSVRLCSTCCINVLSCQLSAE